MNINIFNYLSYGVYIVSTMEGGRAVGCTANCAMQVTAEPATLAVSINHNNYTKESIDKNGNFAISILKDTSDPSIIGTFGYKSSKENDKFSNVVYQMKQDLPVVMDSCGYIICKVTNKFETVTHTIFLGEVIGGEVFDEASNAMTYDYYHKVLKGKSSKNAPTYKAELKDKPSDSKDKEAEESIASKSGDENLKKVKYVCQVCGYEYFEDVVPADFICPICGEGADAMAPV
jgi:flavin reductase (DIM6/NTAB) family NADH-FMN oxidoreductase RutF